MRKREYPKEWPALAETVKELAGWKCQSCLVPHNDNAASGDFLTVHHRDGNPLNCDPGNLEALCQRCHLRLQGYLIRYGVPNPLQLPLPL